MFDATNLDHIEHRFELYRYLTHYRIMFSYILVITLTKMVRITMVNRVWKPADHVLPDTVLFIYGSVVFRMSTMIFLVNVFLSRFSFVKQRSKWCQLIFMFETPANWVLNDDDSHVSITIDGMERETRLDRLHAFRFTHSYTRYVPCRSFVSFFIFEAHHFNESIVFSTRI
jgi:hypothetical protein